MKKSKQGFTLIELMIVVAIIGILAAIAIPKFADLINKSKEGATKGSLSSVRSAIQVYYGDNEGWFPADTLDVLTAGGKYISVIPVAKLPTTGHADSATVTPLNTVLLSSNTSEGGGWGYANNPALTASWGSFMANCTHKDIKGIDSWSTF
jgi:prepilin-type N-terminal cleavage/methylation domain-containing protein